MTRRLVIFAHGKESGPWGSKIAHLAAVAESHGAQTLSPDYSDLSSPEARVARLLGMELPAHDELVLVGSSMGAYVSTLASRALKPKGLFLLAPAFYLPGYQEQEPGLVAQHVSVVHGWSDELIAPDSSFRFARQCGAKLHVLPGDHRLKSALPDIGALFGDFLGRDIGWAKSSSVSGTAAARTP